MTRQQLEHIIRAAAANADTNDIVVIGSQAILGRYPNAPDELLTSIEADVFPKDRPADSILIDGAIGERSIFHQTFGYYAHGVDETTATLPSGWMKRLVKVQNANTRGAIGWRLDPNDLGIAKLAAGREKDIAYVTISLRHGLMDADVLRARLADTPFRSSEHHALASARLERCEHETRKI